MSETNYQRYFGTPEKAAKFIEGNIVCDQCKIRDFCDKATKAKDCASTALEWLESEADDAD